MAYLFIVLPMLLFVLFTLLPVISIILLSFTKYDFAHPPQWSAGKNYSDLLADPFFWKYFKNTLIYAAIYAPASFLVSLLAALLLNRKKMGVGLFRTSFYLPVLSSTIASATIWLWLLNPQSGAINTILSKFGLGGPAWLVDSNYAMTAIVIMSIWASFGSNMMIFLAGLQGVPKHLYESAKLDGANKFQEFIHVTLPGIGPTTFFVTMMIIIGSLQMFDQAYVLTKGGPGGTTTTLVYYIYKAGFGNLSMGYASAMSVVLFAVIMIFSILNMKLNSDSKYIT